MNSETTNRINELLKLIDGVEPVIDFDDPVTDQQHLHTDTLARMYKDKGFRVFLTEAYKSAIKKTALNSSGEVDQAFSKSRAILYKELLIKSKEAFERSTRANQLLNPLKEKLNYATEKGNK